MSCWQAFCDALELLIIQGTTDRVAFYKVASKLSDSAVQALTHAASRLQLSILYQISQCFTTEDVRMSSSFSYSPQIAALQAPFQFSGPKTCDPKGSLKSGTAPWWIPIASFSKSTSATSWTTLTTCLTNEPIYTLKVQSRPAFALFWGFEMPVVSSS